MIFGIALRTFFSLQHIKAASYFANCAHSIEQEADKVEGPHTNMTAHNASVTAAILSSSAFLEATINELFAEAESGSSVFVTLGEQTCKMLDSLWKDGDVERMPILKKFQLMLVAANKEKIDEGGAIYQNVKTLISLRNGLMHYKASWFDTGSENMLRAGALVRSDLSKKMSHSFKSLSHTKFPQSQKWMSADCAIWSVQSALHFADTFFNVLGIPATYDHIRFEITTPERLLK